MKKQYEKKDVKKTSTKRKKKETILTKPIIGLIIVATLLILFNQVQINSISGMTASGLAGGTASSGVGLAGGTDNSGVRLLSSEEKDLSDIDLAALVSTGHTIAAVFPVENIQTPEDAIAILFPTGTPDYGEDLGVSYDNPVESLAVLARMYRGLRAEVQQNNPEGWQRFMNLASRPVGISCEYCCGLQTIGINKQGESACGCQHNPALLSVALYLSAYSDYSDGEILKEVMRWKTLFFPKNMIELGMTVAGGDTSTLDNLPGMVGGC